MQKVTAIKQPKDPPTPKIQRVVAYGRQVGLPMYGKYTHPHPHPHRHLQLTLIFTLTLTLTWLEMLVQPQNWSHIRQRVQVVTMSSSSA